MEAVFVHQDHLHTNVVPVRKHHPEAYRFGGRGMGCGSGAWPKSYWLKFHTDGFHEFFVEVCDRELVISDELAQTFPLVAEAVGMDTTPVPSAPS